MSLLFPSDFLLVSRPVGCAISDVHPGGATNPTMWGAAAAAAAAAPPTVGSTVHVMGPSGSGAGGSGSHTSWGGPGRPHGQGAQHHAWAPPPSAAGATAAAAAAAAVGGGGTGPPGNSIQVARRQMGNPILKHITNVSLFSGLYPEETGRFLLLLILCLLVCMHVRVSGGGGETRGVVALTMYVI